MFNFAIKPKSPNSPETVSSHLKPVKKTHSTVFHEASKKPISQSQKLHEVKIVLAWILESIFYTKLTFIMTMWLIRHCWYTRRQMTVNIYNIQTFNVNGGLHLQVNVIDYASEQTMYPLSTGPEFSFPEPSTI